jgi:hypothetical protein
MEFLSMCSDDGICAFHAFGASAGLTQKPLFPKHFPSGEVAERLKAAVC